MMHTGEKPYLCSYCGNIILGYALCYCIDIISHMGTCDDDKLNVYIVLLYGMYYSLALHTREKPYPCSYCGKCRTVYRYHYKYTYTSVQGYRYTPDTIHFVYIVLLYLICIF